MPYVGRAPSAVPVTADDIPANSIDASKIVDGSIELAEIADNSITDAKLNSSKLDGIADSANNYSHPSAHTVSEVTGLQGLLDGKVDDSQVLTNVPSGALFTDTNTVYTHPTTHATADIADNAITEAKIADAAVVSLKSGRKNLIINGGMNIWQRATTFTGNQAGFQGADRWKCTYQDAGAIKQERVDYTSSTGDIYNSMKLTCTTSGSYGNSVRFQYNLETADVVGLRGKTVTASAYVKQLHADSNFHNFGFQYSNSATDYGDFGSWTAANSAAYTSSLTVNSFVRISRTYTIPNDARSLCVFFDCQSDTGNVNAIIEIANIQLELGSVATDFEHRSYGEELALCQRYAWKYGGELTDEYLAGTGLYRDSNKIHFGPIQYPVTMRGIPSMTVVGSPRVKSNASTSTGWSPVLAAGTASAVFIDMQKTSHGIGSYFETTNINLGSGAYFIFDAEL